MAAAIRPIHPHRLSGAALYLVLAAASSATAQTVQSGIDVDTPGLVVETAAGWDGTIDTSTPVPLSFLFHNHSGRLIRGSLTLSDSVMSPGILLEELALGPNTTRRVASIQGMPSAYQCFVTLRDGDQILWRRELSLTTGAAFDPNYRFALLIDAARSLQLLGGTRVSANVRNEAAIAGEEGWPVRCLTVPSWQVPNHPGPLCVAQAIVFPESAAVADLNKVQWRAVATWMCRGGTVFVHGAAEEVREQLRASSPLAESAPFQLDGFTIRRAGLGAIYEYSEPLFSSEGGEIQRGIGEVIAKLGVNPGVDERLSRNRSYRDSRADLNRALLLFFFLIYALFSGLGSLVLFRLGQRRVAMYTIAVVAGACVVAGLLGGVLRSSRGDLGWTSVTHAGAGGAVQFAVIDIQSAGGRNEHMTVSGSNADLQLLAEDPRHYRWNGRRRNSCPPFSWQSNQAARTDGVYQINVPITPWGSRRLHATAFDPKLRRFDFELDFEPALDPDPLVGETDSTPTDADTGIDNAEQPSESPNLPRGVFSVKLVSHLPFDIIDGWLVVGVTSISAEDGEPIDVYQMRPLRALPSGATHTETFAAEFVPRKDEHDMGQVWRSRWLFPPRLACLGNASAWIIGYVENSPDIAIDEQRSDFVPREQFHIFVQEILPEHMPDPTLFIETSLPQRDAEPDEGTPAADESRAD